MATINQTDSVLLRRRAHLWAPGQREGRDDGTRSEFAVRKATDARLCPPLRARDGDLRAGRPADKRRAGEYGQARLGRHGPHRGELTTSPGAPWKRRHPRPAGTALMAPSPNNAR